MAAAVAAVLALGSVARADTVTLTSLSNSTGLTATVSNYTLVSSTNSSYFILHDLDGGFISNNFDFVLMNRPPSPPDPTQFGVGSIANGIQPGQSATFVISGDFSGLTADEVAHAIYARMQNGTINGSDVVAAPVPEPVTILLFTTGLAGVAARVRRHKADA
jgi:hypothetical protein